MSVPVPAASAVAVVCIVGFVVLFVWSVFDRTRK